MYFFTQFEEQLVNVPDIMMKSIVHATILPKSVDSMVKAYVQTEILARQGLTCTGPL